MGMKFRGLMTMDMLMDTWIRGFQIIFDITKVNKYLVEILNSWIAWPTKTWNNCPTNKTYFIVTHRNISPLVPGYRRAWIWAWYEAGGREPRQPQPDLRGHHHQDRGAATVGSPRPPAGPPLTHPGHRLPQSVPCRLVWEQPVWPEASCEG